ncbi:Alpha/Beta hydrolase protein [Microdochium bolleyi]|uniref:Alpha/Beta hydrolase protein n=1 Tax=Microdochium bolleyi TaxID=196109 RepID=A0A136IN62_9PEZI|nr:Alpha/Beta hydrolase protein [Microdochium bolleyi]
MDKIPIIKRQLVAPRTATNPHTHEILRAGHKKTPQSRPLPCDISYDYNHPFSVRDGVVLRADIYRPANTADPVPAIIMWSPYGKSTSGHFSLNFAPLRVGVPESAVSGYESFEGLDPAEWVPRGYAVVNVDSRGAGQSDGDIYWWGSADARDGHDVIEAVAALPWCSSRVAMAGNSWLAIVQWFIAGQQPPSLTCIAPLEGQSDVYRESTCRGGVPALAFPALVAQLLPGKEQQEDLIAMFKRYPKMNAYWKDKRADMSKIKVPAYIGGSYSTNIHTLGAFRGFEEIPHDKKWLVVHDTQEWHDLYSTARSDDLARFFDFFMKDITNGWDKTPRVRQSLLGFNHPNEVRSADDLPWLEPGTTKALRLYLSADRTMEAALLPQNNSHDDNNKPERTVEYQSDVRAMQADNDPGELSFRHIFASRTVVVGPSKATLSMSPDPHHDRDDLDVWVQLRKADAQGKVLRSLNIPLAELGLSSVDEVPNTSTLKHLGPAGVIRASARKTSPELSRPHWQPLSAEDADVARVAPGKVVKLEISMWPTGMIFEAGESLVLKVAGHDMRLVDVEELQGKQTTENVGKHSVHFGRGRENFVEVYTIVE